MIRFSQEMDARRIIVHVNELTELFDFKHSGDTIVKNLLEEVRDRLKSQFANILHPTDCLCEGSYAVGPLDDLRLRQIDQMLQQRTPPNDHNQGSQTNKIPIHIWFCNSNKHFLFDLIICLYF